MQPAKIISAHKPMDAQLKLDVDLAILLKKKLTQTLTWNQPVLSN